MAALFAYPGQVAKSAEPSVGSGRLGGAVRIGQECTISSD